VTLRQIIPTSVTVAAMLAGFLSILVTVEGMRVGAPGHPYYRWAALLIMLTMILDGLDGNLARLLKGQSDFGAELDTYVDMTAFGIAPALLIFAVCLQSEPLWRVILPSAVAVSGVVRLARFKIKDPLRGQAGYAGLPITVNAGWVAMFVYISQTKPIDRFSLNQGPVAALFLAGVFCFVILQVTNLRYPKPTKNAALYGLCVVLVALLLFLGFTARLERWSVPVAIAMIVLGLGYIVFGPLFVKGMAVHKAWKESRNGQNGSSNGDTSGDPADPAKGA
jgi:CDP-diacylglycerol---serine O-phosphatidyltransferase